MFGIQNGIKSKAISKIRQDARKRLNKRNRRRLKTDRISLIASNCNGAMILHDLGVQFQSPFVNLWMKPDDFIRMLKRLKYYMNCDLMFIKETGIDYPIGMLDDVKLYFMHYKDEDEAKQKFYERRSRIDYDRLYILFTDRDGCTLEHLKEFDKLPYKRKAVFLHEPLPEIKSGIYIKGFENKPSVGMCMAYRGGYKGILQGRKYYDDFDYVRWFNQIESK